MCAYVVNQLSLIISTRWKKAKPSHANERTHQKRQIFAVTAYNKTSAVCRRSNNTATVQPLR